MTKEITDFLKEKENDLPSIEFYTWETEYELGTNEETMHNWIEEHMPEEYTLLEETHEGTYAEIVNEEGHRFAVHASGFGSFNAHKIEFELLETNYQEKMVYKNILDTDDLKALDMLVNEVKMNPAEKRHYLIGVDWDYKIERLEQEDLFDKEDIKAIKKLVAGEKLSNAEKRYYIYGSNIQEKIENLKLETQEKLKVNDINKVKSNNVPDINSLKEGDKILMEFEEMGVKDHFWCDVKSIDDMFTQSGKRMITISVNEDERNMKSDKMVEYGLLKEKRSLLYDYCRHKHHNLEIGEKSYNKRVLEVELSETLKNDNKKSMKLK